MKPRRVAITGLGVLSPLGHTYQELTDNLKANRSSIIRMDDWTAKEVGLYTAVGSPVQNFDDKSIPRKFRRTMSRISIMAVKATQQAIEDSGWLKSDIESHRTGISYGSCMGGISEIETYYRNSLAAGNLVDSAKSSTFLKIMSHTCAANLAVTFSIPGRVIASCVACASSTQAIGFGFEAIKFGLMDRMVCGGAEELNPAVPAVFDVLRATSTDFNDKPQLTPRPFDSQRDGIVVGEGAGTFILEDWDSAIARGAKIYGEVKGFFTNNDAIHMTNPSAEGLQLAMNGALQSAGLSATDIDYINAHATGTTAGDVAEGKAIQKVFGTQVPISSTKGNFGHLMGAAGVIELIASLGMLEQQKVFPTLNLEHPDPELASLNLVKEVCDYRLKHIIKNSFAFGGVNASLVISKD